ncbi:MAG TPA: lytic murein transglycosylase [Alphaproteobacteria bacterium]|nr:lytic murein transglycosylase [Alphaproteobacteria bacterium]
MWKYVSSFVILLTLAAARPAAAEDFDRWLEGVKHDAEAAGVPQATVEAALHDVAPLPRVIELDQRQPETTLTLGEYLSRVIVPKRIAEGRILARHNAGILRRVKAEYAIPPRIILALWAIESSYGHAMGDFRVVDALATLAYDGRRPDLFRAELISALKILSRGHFQPADLKGSWAGAMGQTQFMPSTYLKYAVDLHHSGAPDIWHDTGDVLASAANYLAQLGWNADQGWGREVRLPAGFDQSLIGLSTRKSVADWARLGVRREGGGRLPASPIEGSIVAPDGAAGRAFLVYDNFRTIMKWNHSTYFALAVCLLGDAIGVR